ncbi:hypothetical protein [Spiroplasma endosymbiont of Calodromius spilotus]|uniref:hypothetical protein n=1 Tax=Spiroplasma endosymbiont of Calodromius spilotus TaxID=3077929 RepID=UPI0031FE908E
MINNSNLKETKNLNQTNIQPNGLMKAGLIITIVSSGFILFFALISLTYTLIGAGFIGFSEFIFGGFWITNVILAILAVTAIVTNSLVLAKKSKNYILAGIFGIFSGFIGGILVLCGKFESLASSETNMNS